MLRIERQDRKAGEQQLRQKLIELSEAVAEKNDIEELHESLDLKLQGYNDTIFNDNRSSSAGVRRVMTVKERDYLKQNHLGYILNCSILRPASSRY
ncbi:hypothetical protein B0H19DRAFT_107381 [Mycena capillaripes]|nr:hypothetical protein B0H19DRAFT_107381 [Mycena capillaripes]